MQLMVSSVVSLSIPLCIGRIIDIFSGTANNLPISVPTAAVLLASFFLVGAVASVARLILMRISGQRIIARLRQQAYANVLRQVRSNSGCRPCALTGKLILSTSRRTLAGMICKALRPRRSRPKAPQSARRPAADRLPARPRLRRRPDPK